MKTKLILIIMLLLVANIALAIDPWGSPEILPGSMVLVSRVYINGFQATTGDVVAAFVSANGIPQLRGKASVMLSGFGSGCLLQVFTETNNETVSFRVWDDSAGTVYDLSQTLLSQVNGSVGDYPDNLYNISAGTSAVPDPWPSPQILSESMTVTASVSIEGVPATADDILAAFVSVNGIPVLRGKGEIIVENGIPGCMLQVFTETNGEPITFKVWDYSTQQVYTDLLSLPSQVNGMVGSWPDNLYPINATGGMHQVASPYFSPESGTYTVPIVVSIACPTVDASIHYTTDGSEPTASSSIYTTPLSCPLHSTNIIKARAFYQGYEPSITSTGMYIITGTTATPAFSHAGGSYPHPITVEINCATPNADIHYTTDNSEPTEDSALYNSPIYVGTDLILKAKAFCLGWLPSLITLAEYDIAVSSEDLNAVPLFTGIHSVYPNPFSSQTTIRLGFKDAHADYSLKIYNLKGELVYQTAGNGKGYVELGFNGCDKHGNRLAAGIYLLSFRSGETHQTRKMVLR